MDRADETHATKELMSIGQFAEATGLSVSAVRFYANRGVLRPADVDARSGYRRFAVAQVADGRLIRNLRQLEMPLPTIARALELSPPKQRDLVEGYLEELTASVSRVHAIAQSLDSISLDTAAIDTTSFGPTPPKKDTVMTSASTHSPTDGSVTLSARSLGAALGQVLPVASTDPAVPHLMTVLLEAKDGSVRVVATDRHRLAVRDLVPVSLDSDFAVVLAATTMASWQPLLDVDGDVTVEATADTASLSGSVTAAAERVPTRYPDYQAVLDTPAGVTTITADPSAMTTALKASSEPITLEVTASGVRIGGATEVEAFCTGPPQALVVNATYLRDALAATVGHEVVIDVTNPLAPLVIRSADDGTFTTLVMPVAPE